MAHKRRRNRPKLTAEQKLIKENLRLAGLVAAWGRRLKLSQTKLLKYSQEWNRLRSRNREFFIRLEAGIIEGPSRRV